MKKITTMLLLLMLTAVMVSGCQSTNKDITSAKDEEKSDKISIVTTIYPEYDWAKEIIGDNENIELTMLLDSGVDLHSYQPTAKDIAKISNSDLFIYVGGESDGWVDDALAESTKKDQIVINLLEVLGDDVKEEEVVEGMEAEEEEEEESEEGPEYDEHVWLSLKNAKKLCQAIGEKIMEIDEKNSETYKENLDNYINKLDSLDQEYEETVKNSPKKTLLFGDRFPFRYMIEDYGLKYFAAFVGCSAESEASFKTITFLSKKTDELGLKTILKIESSDGKIAEQIKENTNTKDQEILTMDSMQATTKEDVEKNVTYLKVMTDNLEVLKSALK
ncbi:zinc transport system substrate-binding protein [Acetitomaculum ruminis DSM 5522]|uniref:Zinc transport system substrate-binding protein n=1 Tax=Acetitomaculum ruminis DSM 5522 TaxID=1120918 RepID=A0A1I0Z0B6_9FIRM|nr:metal ABC transporter substrate-binding protein [Acetitomaculum ruminis]SFB18862.1 zinc transport system substrate-binding protein [Acetitomaculum ruminis DSM 5522]